jgi:hypothetical protein
MQRKIILVAKTLATELPHSLLSSFSIRHPISLLQFPVGFLQKLPPVIQRYSIFSRSILSYAAFMSRAPSMLAAMPNLAHTTQLRNKSAMHSHATMMGRHHNKTVDTIMPKIHD